MSSHPLTLSLTLTLILTFTFISNFTYTFILSLTLTSTLALSLIFTLTGRNLKTNSTYRGYCYSIRHLDVCLQLGDLDGHVSVRDICKSMATTTKPFRLATRFRPLDFVSWNGQVHSSISGIHGDGCIFVQEVFVKTTASGLRLRTCFSLRPSLLL